MVGVGTGFLKSTHFQQLGVTEPLTVHFLRGLHVDLRNGIDLQGPCSLGDEHRVGPSPGTFSFAITRSPLRSIKMYTANACWAASMRTTPKSTALFTLRTSLLG